jgi:hypothetical protein
MKTKCPSCDSENTTKCSVAYQTGTSTGSFGGIGIDLQGDIGGFGGVSSSQTLFAQSLSPPKVPNSNPLGLILLGIGGLTVLLLVLQAGLSDDSDAHNNGISILITIVGILLIIMGIFMLSTDHMRKLNLHNVALIKWERQWICMRCGTKFEPKKSDDFESSASE